MQVWLPNPVVISPEPLRENITRATVGPQRIKLPDTHTPLLHPCLCPWFSISCQISFLWQWEWTGIKTLRRTQRGIKQLKNQKQDHFISSYFKNWWDGISRYTTKVHLVASPLHNVLKKPWCRPMITSTITIILSHFFKNKHYTESIPKPLLGYILLCLQLGCLTLSAALQPLSAQQQLHCVLSPLRVHEGGHGVPMSSIHMNHRHCWFSPGQA